MEMKTITLPVLHGATVEWVKAQREEMKARLLLDFHDNASERFYNGAKFHYQYTYKNGFPYMTVSLEWLKVLDV